MISKLRKYRRVLFLSLSCCYTVGVLESPVLEILHSLSHTSSLISGTYYLHSYSDHTHDHSHNLLNIYASMNPGDMDQRNHSADKEKKKKVEILDVIVLFQPIYETNKPPSSFLKRELKKRYLKPESPPPQFA